jgi:hypothetical protein
MLLLVLLVLGESLEDVCRLPCNISRFVRCRWNGRLAHLQQFFKGRAMLLHFATSASINFHIHLSNKMDLGAIVSTVWLRVRPNPASPLLF